MILKLTGGTPLDLGPINLELIAHSFLRVIVLIQNQAQNYETENSKQCWTTLWWTISTGKKTSYGCSKTAFGSSHDVSAVPIFLICKPYLDHFQLKMQ